MRKDLNKRLQKVANNLNLITRLRKVALAEEEMIDRMSARSQKVLLDIRGKFTRVLKTLAPSLQKTGQDLLEKMSQDLRLVIKDDGVVDISALEEVRGGSDQTWKLLSQASKGANSSLHFFNAFEKLLTVAMLGARLQDKQLVERAKADPRYRDRLYKSLEQLATFMPQVQVALQKAQETIPSPEAPPVREPEDSTPLEAVQQQLNSVEGSMRGVVDQLSRVLVKKAAELFGADEGLAAALEDNIAAIYSNSKVTPGLNRNKDFYQEALHLELGTQHLDLGEFLDSKAKKALYLSYRSFVMAARALGVLQFAKKQPEMVAKSEKAQALVVKAQDIVQKRKDTIVVYLNTLRKPKKTESPDKERGIPKGSFSEFFDPEQEPQAVKPPPPKAPEAPAVTQETPEAPAPRKKRPAPREKPAPVEVKKSPKPQRKKKQSVKPEATP